MVQADRGDARALFLFVFFDGERYDGYLWFDSRGAPTTAADRR